MLELYFLVPSCIVFERSNMNLGKEKKTNGNTQNRLLAYLKYEDSTVVSLVAPFIE